MINIDVFQTFLIACFSPLQIVIDEFKEDVRFIDVDCFLDKPYTLKIALTAEDIRFATVSKEPIIDFSLYDYVFENIDDAKELVLKIVNTRKYPFLRSE